MLRTTLPFYLQSLQYQKSYFHKEIASCREFASAYTDAQIGLIDEQGFVAADGGGSSGMTPHALMLKRLAHENQERKRLCEGLETLRAKEKVGSPSALHDWPVPPTAYCIRLAPARPLFCASPGSPALPSPTRVWKNSAALAHRGAEAPPSAPHLATGLARSNLEGCPALFETS